MQIPKIQTIQRDPTSDEHRLVMLDAQDRCKFSFGDWAERLLTRCMLAQLPAELIEILEREDTPLVDRVLRIDYDYWTAGVYSRRTTLVYWS